MPTAAALAYAGNTRSPRRTTRSLSLRHRVGTAPASALATVAEALDISRVARNNPPYTTRVGNPAGAVVSGTPAVADFGCDL